jgi:hypothetical protein
LSSPSSPASASRLSSADSHVSCSIRAGNSSQFFTSVGQLHFSCGSFTSGGGSFACRWSSSGPSRATSSSFCTQSSYYFLCTLLFPTDLRDYSGYEEYFISRRKWFFGFLAATFVADVIDTELKGAAYVHSFGIEYPIRIIANLTLCIIAMFTTNRRAQLTLLAVSFIYHITYIVLLCSTE